MKNDKDAFDENLSRLLKSATRDTAPPLASGLPDKLAARAAESSRSGSLAVLPAALACAVCLATLLALAELLPGEGAGLRTLVVVTLGTNVVLGPVGAGWMIRRTRRLPHAH